MQAKADSLVKISHLLASWLYQILKIFVSLNTFYSKFLQPFIAIILKTWLGFALNLNIT